MYLRPCWGRWNECIQQHNQEFSRDCAYQEARIRQTQMSDRGGCDASIRLWKNQESTTCLTEDPCALRERTQHDRSLCNAWSQTTDWSKRTGRIVQEGNEGNERRSLRREATIVAVERLCS